MVKNILLLLFVVQATLSMEMVRKEGSTQNIFSLSLFKALPSELQRTIFHYIPHKSTFRELNKECATICSVKFPGIFADDLCGLDKQHMIRILLNAAYKKNYDGVENILAKSSLLQQCPNKYIYYCFDINEKGREKAIEVYRLSIKYYQVNKESLCKRDEKLHSILQKYGIKEPNISDALWITGVNKNIMACLAGDTDDITKKDKDSSFAKKERIKIALEVAMSCNNIPCIKKCLEITCAYRNEQQTRSPGRRQCTELLRQLYVIVGQHPRLHFILNDFKDEIAQQEIEYLNEDIKMTFFELICTIS